MKLLIGTAEGLFTTDGNTKAWSADGLLGKSVRPLYSAGDTLYAGADDGLYRSRDGGSSWQRCGLEGRIVWDITTGPDGTDVLYAGTQPAGFFCSHDGGTRGPRRRAS